MYTYIINISSKTIRSLNSCKMNIILYIVHYYTSRTATSARPQNYVIFIPSLVLRAEILEKFLNFHFPSRSFTWIMHCYFSINFKRNPKRSAVCSRIYNNILLCAGGIIFSSIIRIHQSSDHRPLLIQKRTTISTFFSTYHVKVLIFLSKLNL